MTHRARAPLTVWRIARTVEIERQVSSEPPATQHRLKVAGVEAAIGFSMDVDGIRVEVLLPDHLPTERGSDLDRALRTTYFEHLVLADPILVARTPSRFLREWLAQLALCAVVTASADADADADSALVEVSDGELSGAMVQAARVVFGAEGPSDDPNAPAHDPGLVSDVENALHDREVVTALQECLATLSGPLPAEALGWFSERYASTVATGFIGAVQAMCPDLDVDDLRPDFEILSSPDGEPFARITISEDQPGGTGVIETAVDRIVEDPRAFWAVVTSVLGPCDGERIDETLRRFLGERQSGCLATEVDSIRVASTLSATTDAWASLRETMFRSGIDADQTVISALATRLLRPGSDASVEQLCQNLLDRWDSLEDELGLEVDLRVFAYLAARDDDVRRSLAAITSLTGQGPEWTVGQIVGLLWSRGSRLRAASLQSYNPYAELPTTERLLVEPITREPIATVQFSSADWRDDLDDRLCVDGIARIACPGEETAAEVLRELMTAPTAVGVLEFHPRVVGVERSNGQLTLIVDIREAQQ